MKDNNVLGFLIPLIAILVIFESVVLVSNLTQTQKKNLLQSGGSTLLMDKTNDSGSSGKIVEDKKEEVAYDVVFETDEKNMKLGKEYSVEVHGISKIDTALDAVVLYVKYDPNAFDVSSLSFDEKLGKPTFSTISTKKQMLVVNYLISESKGLGIKAGETLSILKFKVKPKKTGDYKFEISTSNETKESVTMFVENSTSRPLPFSSNALNINVAAK